MGRCRVVQPEVVRLALSDGDWIEVRRRLNAGEHRAMMARMYLAGVDGKLRVNPLQTGIARILAYLLDWSLVGIDGKVIPIADKSPDVVQAAVDDQDDDTVAEIMKAINAHEEAMELEREQEKNVRAGEKNGSVISPLRSEPAGHPMPSVN